MDKNVLAFILIFIVIVVLVALIKVQPPAETALPGEEIRGTISSVVK